MVTLFWPTSQFALTQARLSLQNTNGDPLEKHGSRNHFLKREVTTRRKWGTPSWSEEVRIYSGTYCWYMSLAMLLEFIWDNSHWVLLLVHGPGCPGCTPNGSGWNRKCSGNFWGILQVTEVDKQQVIRLKVLQQAGTWDCSGETCMMLIKLVRKNLKLRHSQYVAL